MPWALLKERHDPKRYQDSEVRVINTWPRTKDVVLFGGTRPRGNLTSPTLAGSHGLVHSGRRQTDKTTEADSAC